MRDLYFMPQPLFKYIGNKYRSAKRIVEIFPKNIETYYEPFVGSAAVLGELGPKKSVASDTCRPLIELWRAVQNDPQRLLDSYYENWKKYQRNKLDAYEEAKKRFNDKNNPYDFLFISRACYGGVIRFRKDGYLSTPLGPHQIISPESFSKRLTVWRSLVRNTEFVCADFSEVIQSAGDRDLIYCDPPYIDSQKILYGAQSFVLERLFAVLSEAKDRGARAVVSIDGEKKSGAKSVFVDPPAELFEVEAYISLGGSMLKRFWNGGMDMVSEHVRDRLLVSFDPSAPKSDLFEVEPRFRATG